MFIIGLQVKLGKAYRVKTGSERIIPNATEMINFQTDEQTKFIIGRRMGESGHNKLHTGSARKCKGVPSVNRFSKEWS